MFIQILGLSAGAFIVASSLPQIFKIIKTQRTGDISLTMYVILNIGTVLWIIYGLLTSQLPVIIPNVIFLIFNVSILYLKIKHK